MKYCSGCGVELQAIDMQAKGYIIAGKNHSYCLRCFKLKHYNQLLDIDFDLNLFYDRLQKIILQQTKKTRFFYVLDVLDILGSRIEKLEILLKDSEVIFCVNKVDIFPNVVDEEKIYDYVLGQLHDTPIIKRQLLLVSARRPTTIDKLLEVLDNEESDNYFIGVSNTGKSSILNACLKQQKLPQAIVTSYFTNTTLDVLEVDLQLENKVYDTPGIAVGKSILNAIAKKDWKHFIYNDELKQFTYQLKPANVVILEKIMWLEFLGAQTQLVSFHFWTNKYNTLHRTNHKNVEKYLNNNQQLIKPSKNRFNRRLFDFDKHENINIVISGLGWINFKAQPGLKLAINIPQLDNDEVYVYLNKN